MLTLPVGRVLGKVLNFLGTWWREVLILSLVAAVWLQITRVHAREETIGQRDQTIQSMKDAAKVAESKSAERGATTGAEATVDYVQRNEADRPVVERVVERVRNVCLRPPDPVRVPVPEGTAVADAAPSGTQDREDDAFAQAIADDLQACNAELNKLTALQDWVAKNGG